MQFQKDLRGPLTSLQQQVLFGMMLGDATMYESRTHQSAFVKIEQGWKQRAFVDHLFEVFQTHTRMAAPKPSFAHGRLKSYWFYTVTAPCFYPLYTQLYQVQADGKRRKVLPPGLITELLTPCAFAYWVMCDGSHRNRLMTLHTEGFTEAETHQLSVEVNALFGLHSSSKCRDAKYWVLRFPVADFDRLYRVLEPWMLSCFRYKMGV
jgi:hypothetical protein